MAKPDTVRPHETGDPVDFDALKDLIANARARDLDDAELGNWVRCYVNQLDEAVQSLARRAGQ